MAPIDIAIGMFLLGSLAALGLAVLVAWLLTKWL